MLRENFLDRILDKLDSMDKNNIHAYAVHLAKEKGFIETIFNTIREGIIVVDRSLMIKYHNHAAEGLLGFPDDISKLRISQFLHGVDWISMMSEDAEKWYRSSRQEIEILYPVKRILNFHLLPNENDRDLAIIILHDITEHREKSLSRHEKEKAELISVLAASVAHEIGNPLNSLSLHLQLMQRNLKSGGKLDLEEMEEIVKVANTEISRLDSIISQFLSALRPSKPHISPTDLTELIVETLNFMKNELQDKNIRVNCSWSEKIPLLQADSQQLKQVFYNLLKNSMQALRPGGEIKIKCSFDEDSVKVSFSDNGSGMQPESMSKIFSPYYSSKKRGSGLGLLIVERILREHGADFAVNSREEEGTVFEIKFQIHPKKTRVLPLPSNEKTEKESEK